ncbi:MAG: LmeA family phospholipid-binding protein [Chloroflexi bacterium]|nr:LmeA family phospholipid-binding protein [Chloroflexota bacterium]
MKKYGFTNLLAPAALVMFAALACSSVTVGGPTPEHAPIAVSTEAVGSLLDKFKSLSSATGEVTVSITESELTSWLAGQLASDTTATFTHPQVYLRDGQIKFYSTVVTSNFTANALVVMKAAVVNGQIDVSLVTADFGPVPVPGGMLKTLTSTLNDKLLSLVNDAPGGVTVTAITVGDGALTMTANIAP